jgi:hypothetical protein
MNELVKALSQFQSKFRKAHFDEWREGKWLKSNRPAKVAVIVDEATDIDLAEGLISTVRETISHYSYLASEGVALILAGVGLEAIQESNRIGTNPSYSQLIVMRQPNFQTILQSHKSKQAIMKALDQGVYSSVLKTNTRMFFRSILPILESGYHKIDGKFDPQTEQMHYEDRLVDIGSYKSLMNHAPKFYVKANSVKEFDPGTLNNLLMQAFVYHLDTAMQNAKMHGGDSTKRNMEQEIPCVQCFANNLQDKVTSNIFCQG